MRQPRQPRPPREPREPRVKETNRLTPCPICGAPVGETCFRVKTGKELGKTHRTNARNAVRRAGRFS
jgi:hypothetical protein